MYNIINCIMQKIIMDNKKRKNEVLEIIYKAQQEKLDEIIKNKRIEIKDTIKTIDVEEMIKNIENKKDQIKIKEIIKEMEDNYNIKMSEYNKVMYKQGFIDGINLILECLN